MEHYDRLTISSSLLRDWLIRWNMPLGDNEQTLIFILPLFSTTKEDTKDNQRGAVFAALKIHPRRERDQNANNFELILPSRSHAMRCTNAFDRSWKFHRRQIHFVSKNQQNLLIKFGFFFNSHLQNCRNLWHDFDHISWPSANFIHIELGGGACHVI